MRCFITGAAGFIGSHLVDRLLLEGHEVIGFDNFSTGQERFLVDAEGNPAFQLVRADLLDSSRLSQAMQGCDLVYHLAANADVRFGLDHPHKDLEQNTIATFNVLEAMRFNRIRRIVFSSTGSIYGEPEVHPTPENAPFPVQTSLYGASKLACEGLIQAYCTGFDFQAYVFRFVSILGERYSHGHVFDFYKQILEHPDHLMILGNGHQRKSYLYIRDCIDAIQYVVEHTVEQVNIYNLGTDEYCEVNDSIKWISDALDIKPELRYAGGERGWVGDSPFIFLDTTRIRQLGWKPKCTIREGIIKTLNYLQANHWLLEKRP